MQFHFISSNTLTCQPKISRKHPGSVPEVRILEEKIVHLYPAVAGSFLGLTVNNSGTFCKSLKRGLHFLLECQTGSTLQALPIIKTVYFNLLPSFPCPSTLLSLHVKYKETLLSLPFLLPMQGSPPHPMGDKWLAHRRHLGCGSYDFYKSLSLLTHFPEYFMILPTLPYHTLTYYDHYRYLQSSTFLKI